MFKKPSMIRHEGVCFYNPHRGCPVCGENNTDVLENAKFLVANNFEALSQKVSGCPACIVSATIRLNEEKLDSEYWHFDYKEAKENWEQEKRDLERQEQEFSTY